MVKKLLFTLFLVLVQTVVFGANISSTATGGNWSATTTWVGGVVPSSSDNVTVVSGSTVNLDTNITIGNATYTFNGNVTDSGTHTLTATTSGGKLIISNNSTTTFGGSATWDNSIITVNLGSTLVVGTLTIANGSTISVVGSLIVNGDMTDNNNGSWSLSVTGYVQVYGNYTASVGNVSVSGVGVFQTTGTITTTGSSTVGDSTNECSVGPCSSGSISCGSGGISYASFVSPTNQVLCSGQTISPISFVTNATVTSYQWQISTTNGGIGFTDIGGANSNNYSPSQPSVTTWYRMKYSTSGCSDLISPSSQISLNNNTPPVSGTIGGGNVSYCSNTNSTVITLSGYTATGFQWQSSSDNITFANISSATSASYTATNVSSTTYYRVVVSNGSCNTVNSSSVAITKVSTGAPAAPGAITGLTAQCAGNTLQVYSITPVAYATSYAWTVDTGSGWAITSGQGTNSITVTIGTGSANVSVNAINACGTGYGPYLWVEVSLPTVAGTVTPANTNVCSGSNSTNLSLSGHFGSIVRWESSLDNFAGGAITTINSFGTPMTAVNLTVDTYFRAVVQSGGCNLLYSNSVKITVYGALPSTPGLISINGGPGINAISTTYCASSTVVFSVAEISNASSYTWTIGPKWTYVSGQGTRFLTLISPPVVSIWWGGVDNISVSASNLTCVTPTATWLEVGFTNNSLATPTASATVQPSCLSATGTITITAPTGSGITYSIDGTNYTNTNGVFTTLVPGTYNVTAKDITGCVSSVTSVIINAQPLTPSTPTIGTITHATCVVGTGSVVLSGLGASGTINQTGTVPNSYTITGTTMTISGLAPGTYNFTVSNGTCTSSPSADVVVNASITKTWNGSSWSPSAPTINDGIIFNGFYSSDAYVEGCSCQVNSGTVVTIESGATLKIANGVTVLGSGILEFDVYASLVQINDAAINTGNIRYKRHTSIIKKTDYTYWSSPVSNQKLIDVSPDTFSSMFYSFNATGNQWKQENSGNVMEIGKGYIIRGPESLTAPNPLTGIHLATFIGVPNNGIIMTPIGGVNTSNLIGNPYSSAIDADLFLDANSTVLEGNLYFWTHATEIQLRSNITNGSAGSGDYVYTSDDYATYNRTGGVGTTGNFVDGLVEDISNKPEGKIAAGQGFFATGIVVGNAMFNNSMRVSGGTFGENNTQFFKSVKNSKEKISKEKHRVWLNLTNDKGAFKQTLVGYVTKATNGYDKAFDAESFNANKFVNFYSVNENKNLTIQGRTLPFDENDEVPLGYSSAIKGVFSIAIDEVDGLLGSKDIFLEDKKTNVVKNLKEGAYSFSTETGTFNDRFVLRYVNTNKTLGNDDFKTLENIVLVSKDKNELKIKSQLENIERITIFDLLGRKVFDKEAIESTEFHFSNSTLNKQTIIVKVTLTTGAVISKKVIY